MLCAGMKKPTITTAIHIARPPRITRRLPIVLREPTEEQGPEEGDELHQEDRPDEHRGAEAQAADVAVRRRRVDGAGLDAVVVEEVGLPRKVSVIRVVAHVPERCEELAEALPHQPAGLALDRHRLPVPDPAVGDERGRRPTTRPPSSSMLSRTAIPVPRPSESCSVTTARSTRRAAGRRRGNPWPSPVRRTRSPLVRLRDLAQDRVVDHERGAEAGPVPPRTAAGLRAASRCR